MNTLTSGNFIASRQANGDVWIRPTKMYWKQPIIKIPQEHCAELARLLLWPVISEDHKVDYTLSVNEPE